MNYIDSYGTRYNELLISIKNDIKNNMNIIIKTTIPKLIAFRRKAP